MVAPLSNLHLKLKFLSASPLISDFFWDFSYFTTFTTQDITDVAALVNHLTASITSVPSGGTNAPSKYLSGVISTGANQSLVDVYDVTNHLNGSPAGSPVLMTSWTYSPGLPGGVMPEGASAVITQQAPYGTDVEFAPGTRPRARDRGRLYFGPLSANAVGADGSNRSNILSVCRTDLCKWIQSINTYTSAPHTVVWNLGVWSRKNAAMKSLQQVSVDDRIDYHRLRAGHAGTKTTIGLP